MAEGRMYTSEPVSVGATIVVSCPNGCGPSLSMEWVTTTSGTVIGHWLACAGCRPDGAWSCSFCPDLITADGPRIRAHLADDHGF